MRENALRIAQKLGEISKQGRCVRGGCFVNLGENGESWEVEEIINRLGGH